MNASPPSADPEENGPPGDAFYNAPDPERVERHGDAIYQRKLDNRTAKLAHGRNWLVLYRSDDAHGKPIAVSGIIVLPNDPPRRADGYPLISWAHGTVGVAPGCAPSRDYPESSAHPVNVFPHTLLNHFLDQGWALAMTDYEGLGVEGGRHPYMLGLSEAYGVLDIVQTARRLFPGQISGRYAIVGHSQGGQAALFAASEGARTEGLTGVAAIEPANHPLGIIRAGAIFGTTNDGYAFTPMFLAGAIGGDPGIHPQEVLSEKAFGHWPDVDQECRAGLSNGFWGTVIKGNEQFKGDYLNDPNGDQQDFDDQLLKMNPKLSISVPIRITQSIDDRRVEARPLPPLLGTDALVRELRDVNPGRTLDYKFYGLGVVRPPQPDPGGLGVHFAAINHDLPALTGWLKPLIDPDG
jgi:Secretory lipase